MRTFLEMEGKLGPIPQSPNNQNRPPQPDISPKVKKAIKITEKGKRVVPTKRFKANVAMKSYETTARPPMTISKALTDFKFKHLHKKEFQKIDPHH